MRFSFMWPENESWDDSSKSPFFLLESLWGSPSFSPVWVLDLKWTSLRDFRVRKFKGIYTLPRYYSFFLSLYPDPRQSFIVTLGMDNNNILSLSISFLLLFGWGMEEKSWGYGMRITKEGIKEERKKNGNGKKNVLFLFLSPMEDQNENPKFSVVSRCNSASFFSKTIFPLILFTFYVGIRAPLFPKKRLKNFRKKGVKNVSKKCLESLFLTKWGDEVTLRSFLSKEEIKKKETTTHHIDFWNCKNVTGSKE